MFSGIGGFSLGIGNKGVCVGYSEIDKYAIQVYEKHFPQHKNYRDCTKINVSKLPAFDLLTAGFPCQSFSIAGKRRGFKDTRGTLFFEIARIAKAKRPKNLLLENVKGLLSHDKGNTFATIIGTLDELGYDCEWCVLNSKNFGVPQNRERVFIIGYLRGSSRRQVFPIGETKRNDAKLEKSAKSVKSPTLTARGAGEWHSGMILVREPQIRRLTPTLNTTQGGNRQPFIQRQPLIRYLNRNQKNIKGDYAFTVDASQTSGVRIDQRIRRLTPVECARLQGFPDDWHEGLSDTQAYKVYGNAVTVNVAKAIIQKLYEK